MIRCMGFRLNHFWGIAFFLVFSFQIFSFCSSLPKQELEQPSVARHVFAGKISEITLERSVCFGDCPAYKVVFRSNGTATYTGEANTPFIGEYEADSKSYPGSYFEQMSRWLYVQKYFDLKDVYNENLADSSAITITVVRDGKRKTIIDYDSEQPIEIWGIAMAIDGAVSKIKWNKVSR